MGYTVISESAREVLASSPAGAPGALEVQGDLQERIFLTQRHKESELDPSAPLFLDRGVPDSMAYNKIVEKRSALIETHMMEHQYRAVFFCHAVPLQRDGLRSEDEQWNRRVGDTLRRTYTDLDYRLVDLPSHPDESPTKSIARRLIRLLEEVEDLS